MRTFVELVERYVDPELCPYPEYKGKPYYSIKYIENGEEYVGYSSYSLQVMSGFLKKYFMSPALEKQEWHNARKDPPKRPDNMWDTYYVYTRFDRYGIAKYYAHGKWDGYDEDGDQIGEYEIIAYCNFKPYTEEES